MIHIHEFDRHIVLGQRCAGIVPIVCLMSHNAPTHRHVAFLQMFRELLETLSKFFFLYAVIQVKQTMHQYHRSISLPVRRALLHLVSLINDISIHQRHDNFRLVNFIGIRLEQVSIQYYQICFLADLQ